MASSRIAKEVTNYTYDTLGNLVLETVKNKSVDYENTPENAREILANLGQNIDIVAGPSTPGRCRTGGARRCC